MIDQSAGEPTSLPSFSLFLPPFLPSSSLSLTSPFSPSISPLPPPFLPSFPPSFKIITSYLAGSLAKFCKVCNSYLPPSPLLPLPLTHSGSVASGHLAECLRQFITTLLRPRACKIGGLLYRSPEHSAVAVQYWDQCWTIYQKLWGQTWCGRQSENTVTMRQTLLLLEVHTVLESLIH